MNCVRPRRLSRKHDALRRQDEFSMAFELEPKELEMG